MVNNFIIVVDLIALICILFFVGVSSGKALLKQELAGQGHAEYYLNSNNDKQWRIKE